MQVSMVTETVYKLADLVGYYNTRVSKICDLSHKRRGHQHIQIPMEDLRVVLVQVEQAPGHIFNHGSFQGQGNIWNCF